MGTLVNNLNFNCYSRRSEITALPASQLQTDGIAPIYDKDGAKESETTRFGIPPRGDIKNIPPPSRSETKAIHSPSGDQAGFPS